MTGVAPNSIAAQVVNGLLAGGATVVATSHSFRQSVKAWAKQTYREHAAGDAKLWLVPANLSSYRDVDALVAWVGNVQKKTSGATTTILKPAYEPSLFFPFAAPPVHGTLTDSGELFESQARLMLWGVERAIAGLSAIGADTDVQHKLHVILPGSPNRGVFGGDGAYGEVKSAFDAIVNRARAEKVWSSRVTFAHPKIGWVRGTGLMGGNDPLVEVVERHGLKTYSTAEIAVKLLELSTKESREQAVKAPLDVDLTGGLGSEPINIKALRAEAMEDAAKAAAAEAGDEDKQGDCAAAATLIKALPYDRVRTSMAAFPLCPACRAEYENPLDRRFHAEPIACPVCGPQLAWKAGAATATGEAALAATLAALRAGGIVALRGIGGYHLVCDARNEAAVATLRERKQRPSRPFAVLFADTDEQGAWIAMQYLAEQVESYNARKLHPWSLHFSWGLSEFDHNGNDLQQWLKEADEKMYAMKQQRQRAR